MFTSQSWAGYSIIKYEIQIRDSYLWIFIPNIFSRESWISNLSGTTRSQRRSLDYISKLIVLLSEQVGENWTWHGTATESYKLREGRVGGASCQSNTTHSIQIDEIRAPAWIRLSSNVYLINVLDNCWSGIHKGIPQDDKPIFNIPLPTQKFPKSRIAKEQITTD